MKRFLRLIVPLVLALSLVLGISFSAQAATTATVTIIYTPRFIALTNDDSDWAAGTVTAGTVYWWTTDSNAPAPEPFEAADMIATVTNTGNVAEDIDIKAANPTGGAGQTISTDDTPAGDEVSIRAGATGTANAAGMVQVITTDTELMDSLAASGTKKWCMSLKMGVPTDGVEKSCTVTLTASVAD